MIFSSFRLISLFAVCFNGFVFFPNFAWAYHANSSQVWSWTKIWSYTWYKWSCIKMGISTQTWPNVTLWLSYATLAWNKGKKLRICTPLWNVRTVQTSTVFNFSIEAVELLHSVLHALSALTLSQRASCRVFEGRRRHVFNFISSRLVVSLGRRESLNPACSQLSWQITGRSRGKGCPCFNKHFGGVSTVHYRPHAACIHEGLVLTIVTSDLKTGTGDLTPTLTPWVIHGQDSWGIVHPWIEKVNIGTYRQDSLT